MKQATEPEGIYTQHIIGKERESERKKGMSALSWPSTPSLPLPLPPLSPSSFLEPASAPLNAISPWYLPQVTSNSRAVLSGPVPCPWVTSPPIDSYGRT